MPVESITDPAAKKLADEWIKYKQEEETAKAKRLTVEGKMILLLDASKSLPDKGSVKVGSVKIVTDYTKKWDQEALQTIRSEWEDNLPTFPFQEELKPIGDDITYLEKNMPDVYKRLMPALSKEPKKPAFSK
jgi:hypothetical protein